MSCSTGGPFGAFPNCDTLGASLFLNLVYGCGLLQAANLISDGSELLLEVLSPGLVGGLLLPILGAVPDAAVIVASGLGATQEEAQEQVSVGMGTLAGSTVMLLTVAWGGSLWVGRCDLDGFTGKAIQKQCSHGLADSFANTGVTVDGDTTLNARIMIASCLAFLAPQAAAFAGRGADGLADLVGAAVAFAGLAAYCAFQVLHPELQKRKIAAARLRQAKRYGAQIAHHIGLSVGGIVVDGDINAAALDRLFDQFDADGNGQIEVHELKAALVAMSVTMKDYNVSDADVAVWLREFDRDGDGLISRSEFCGGMTHWVLEQTRNAERRDADGASADERISTIREPSGVVSTRSQRRGLSLVDPLGGDGMEPLLGAEAPDSGPLGGEALSDSESDSDSDGDEDEDTVPPTKLAIVRESALKLTAGMVLIAVFADPMVGAVSSLSRACGMPSPFFASFVLTPFASNASELVSSLYFAAKKKKKNISLTYSQIYGAVTMNNTMCLGLFLVVMRAKGLEWTFTSETICVVAATVAVGAVGASKKTLKTSLVLPALAVYPLSLGLVVFLDFVVGLK
jgi:Ca2+/Na+ antiporter